MKVLMVLTSHDKLGATREKTGFWLEEFAAPYYVFKDAGAQITLASPLGGQPPVDPRSESPKSQTEATRRFNADRVSQEQLAHTVKLGNVSASDYDAVFYPGGHGPLWDLTEDRASIGLIERMFAANKPVGAVCHAPGALRYVRAPNGALLVDERKSRASGIPKKRPLASRRWCRSWSKTCSRATGASIPKAVTFRPTWLWTAISSPDKTRHPPPARPAR